MLVATVVGLRVFATSPKPQKGVHAGKDFQIVFHDSPVLLDAIMPIMRPLVV
jgi:hypothetical protein